MALSTTAGSGGPILTPEDVQALVIQPLIADSIATQASTVVVTNSTTTRFPIVQTDPTAAWTPEGQEIALSDADLDELIVTPKKLAGLSILSNELVADGNSALDLVGQGLVRDLRTRLDAAFFGTTIANGPNGIQGLAGLTTVTGGSLADLDAFAEAISKAELVGEQITSWVAHPTTALALAKLKDQTGSNRPLLGDHDPSQPTRRTALGLPILSAPGCALNYIYGIPRAASFVVLRVPATVEVDKSVKFTSDSTAVRCVLRVGFAWPHPAGIVRIGLGGS